VSLSRHRADGGRHLGVHVDNAVRGDLLTGLGRAWCATRIGRDDPDTVKLTGVYHNLIRHWAEV
jgi:predicted 2-oxoglutarate/Fe(II)-dependent dioxygenase YbiX